MRSFAIAKPKKRTTSEKWFIPLPRGPSKDTNGDSSRRRNFEARPQIAVLSGRKMPFCKRVP